MFSPEWLGGKDTTEVAERSCHVLEAASRPGERDASPVGNSPFAPEHWADSSFQGTTRV